MTMHFNPRSREGSDKLGKGQRTHIIISIHAPARGATVYDRPAAGRSDHFNPRSREGSDPRDYLAADTGGNISIHAPARGATEKLKADLIDAVLFQSTLPRGERRDAPGYEFQRTIISIHAPARGATEFPPHGLKLQLHFNPRSREGSDKAAVYVLDAVTISIHAPARGATPRLCVALRI